MEPQADQGRGPQRGRERWWIVAAVVLVIAVVVGVGVAAVRWWRPDDSRTNAAPAARPPAPVGTPKDLLVPFPLNRQPVPGWQLTATDLGLPPGTLGDVFATVGQNAYFRAVRNCEGACRDPTSFLYGVDTTTGRRLFPPVPMPGFSFGYCHLNGPRVALCTASSQTETIAESIGPPTIWVVDLRDGHVTHTGPTDLDTPGGPRVIDIGGHFGTSRAVAEVEGKGIYGIGDHGELTWFAPGDGNVANSNAVTNDVPAHTITVQSAVDIGGLPRVYSIVDGTDLTPTVPTGTTIERPQVYNGGFAYDFSEDGGKAGTLFYDTTGHQVARHDKDRARLQPNWEMPIAMIGSNLIVYTADGNVVTQLPANDIISQTQIIGTKLYLHDSGYGWDDTTWQQWDLLTGARGPTCQFQLGVSYIASDGNVIVTRTNENTIAIDPVTCQVLWTVPGTNGLWKAGTNLINRSPDQTTLTSLRPPD